jgi:hypothetical protein
LSDEDRWEVRIQQISEFKRVHGHLKVRNTQPRLLVMIDFLLFKLILPYLCSCVARQIPKNSQSALYYWAYGAKKKWRKYKDKRQRDLVHIGLISAEEYEAERLAKQGVTEFSPAAAAQRPLAPGGSSSAQPSPQLPRPVLPSSAQTRAPVPGAASPSFPAFRTPSLDDPRVLPLERTSSRGSAPAAAPTVIRTTNTTEQHQQRIIPKPASAAASGLMHLGLIGEEEYEKEVFGHTNTNSNGSTTTTSPTRSPVRIPTAIKPEPTPKPAINTSGSGGGSDAGVDRKLKDLVALGLLSWDEYEQQRGPAADTAAAAARTDLKRKSAETERLPVIVVDDSDAGAGGGLERRIKRGRVSSFNELLVQRYDADIAATAGLRDERSDGEEPLTRSPDIGDELYVNHSLTLINHGRFTATHIPCRVVSCRVVVLDR